MAVLLSFFKIVIYAYLSHNKRSLFIKICVHLYKTMSITSFLQVQNNGRTHLKGMINIYSPQSGQVHPIRMTYLHQVQNSGRTNPKGMINIYKVHKVDGFIL